MSLSVPVFFVVMFSTKSALNHLSGNDIYSFICVTEKCCSPIIQIDCVKRFWSVAYLIDRVAISDIFKVCDTPNGHIYCFWSCYTTVQIIDFGTPHSLIIVNWKKQIVMLIHCHKIENQRTFLEINFQLHNFEHIAQATTLTFGNEVSTRKCPKLLFLWWISKEVNSTKN